MDNMEEVTLQQQNNEELFEYVDQCMINLQLEDQMINKHLEVLLILIKEAKIDIEQLFVSSVTEQFLSYVEHLKEKSIEEVGSYLVIATKILEIKAKAMLPIVEDDDFDGEYDFGADEDAIDISDTATPYLNENLEEK